MKSLTILHPLLQFVFIICTSSKRCGFVIKTKFACSKKRLFPCSFPVHVDVLLYIRMFGFTVFCSVESGIYMEEDCRAGQKMHGYIWLWGHIKMWKCTKFDLAWFIGCDWLSVHRLWNAHVSSMCNLRMDVCVCPVVGHE